MRRRARASPRGSRRISRKRLEKAPREPARLAQDLEEEAPAGEVAAELLVHQVQVAADIADCRRTHAAELGVLLEQEEDLEQGERMAPEDVPVHDLDLPAAHLEAPIEAPDRRPALPVEKALAEELEQQLVQPAEGLDGPVVALHELLDAEVVVGVAVPEMRRDRDLAIEEQAVLAAAGEVMERAARLPQEVLAVAQAPELLFGQESVIEEVAEPRHRPLVRTEVAPRHPRDGLDVPESARSFLHVRLEVVARVAVAQVPLALLALLGVKELPGRPHARGRDRPAHLFEECARAGQVTGLDEIGDDGEIATGFVGALPDASHRVPHLEPEVPRRGNERFDAGVRAPSLEDGRPPFADQQQQVDVRAWMQLPPAVSADRDERRLAVQSEVFPGSAKRVVRRRRPLRNQLAGRSAGVESCPDPGLTVLEGGAKSRLHRSAASRWGFGLPRAESPRLGHGEGRRRERECRGGAQARPPSTRVRTSQPSGVTRIVCSHWAE